MRIRTRAILVIIATNVAIILLSILAGTGYVRKKIEKYIESDMLVVADIADRFISSELAMLRHDAGAIADDLSAVARGEWSAALAEQARLHPKFIGMSVMSRDAGIVAATGKSPASPALLENTRVRRAFSGRTAFTSTVPAGEGVVFHLAVPIPGGRGDLLALTLDGMHFSELASAYHVWETGHIFIDDSEGHIIANIRPEWVRSRQNFIKQAQNDPRYEDVASVVGKLVAGGRGIGYYSLDGITRICAYRPISGSEEGWRLGIVAPLSESPARDVDRGLLLVAAVGFALNVAAAVIASNLIKKPFEEVAALQARAEEASRAKSSFLAHMSHEIRTPLNAVIGLSALALDDDALRDESKGRLENIHASGMTILSIANNILDISKIESGKFELDPVQYDVPSLINDIVTLNAALIGEKPIAFKLDIDENLPVSLYGDNLRVKQIFNNLLSNALKYSDSGTVEWKVSFKKDKDGVQLVSSVRDTGIGIKPADMRKLFSDYSQVDAKANRKVEGTGLGLAIAKRLAGMMDGIITAESEYGKGSTFHVRLRQGIASDAPIGKTVAENLMRLRYAISKSTRSMKQARANLSHAHVLVVDDIATNLDVVKGMLKPYGLKVACASDGPQAIEMIRAGHPRYDAVFMDHMMPGMDGIEAMRIMRKEIGTEYARNVPIIALTANAIAGNEEMFLSLGFQDFIPKPIDMARLDATLRRWVRGPGQGNGDAPEAGNAGSGSGDCAPAPVAIDGVDARKALERFSGDGEVLVDVLRSYAANTPPLVTRLGEYLAAGNLGDYAIVVHGIKGSSRGISAREAGKAAEALELAAKAGDADAVRAGHPAFEKLMEALLGNINRALGELDAASAKPSAAEPDPALLRELCDACGALDMDGVDAAMARIESFRYERGGELVAWLRRQVDDMTLEKIAGGEWPTARQGEQGQNIKRERRR